MQKKLIALAVAGVFSAPAFAATSNVDVYGVMSFSVDRIDTNDATGDSTDTVTGRDNVSRIGFKGSEDLGGGLSAIWQVEMQLNANNDSGVSTTTNTTYGGATVLSSASVTDTISYRNTFVGLKSASMGTVILGRHDTPYKLATGKLDPFVDTIGDYNAIIGQTDNGGNLFDLRSSGLVAYITPNFSGFSGSIAYAEPKLNEGVNVDNASILSAMGMYENGPLFASLAYETHSGNLNGSSLTSEVDAWKVGLGYTFGNTAFGLVYEDIERDDANQNSTRDAWYASIKHTMGNVVLKGAYGVAGDGEGAGNNDTGAKFFALGADYLLSKRTSVYGVYSSINQDTNGSYNMLNYSAVGDNRDVDGFSLGVKHTF